MLFLVISDPRPERPSAATADRQRYWQWATPLLEAKRIRSIYARPGRGAVAIFDVDSTETLHRYLNEWAEIIPAHFDLYPLIEPTAARQFLDRQ
jgi:hypothetical protein